MRHAARVHVHVLQPCVFLQTRMEGWRQREQLKLVQLDSNSFMWAKIKSLILQKLRAEAASPKAAMYECVGIYFTDMMELDCKSFFSSNCTFNLSKSLRRASLSIIHVWGQSSFN